MSINKIFDKAQHIFSTFSRRKYIQYLRSKGAAIGNNVYFVNPRNTHFDLNRAKFITIGDEVIICAGVSLLAHDHSWIVPMKRFKTLLQNGGGRIEIGNNVFIGESATILRNVKIGNNVIVSARSVVTKDCEDDSVYGGVPARRIMTLEEYANKIKARQETEIFQNYKTLVSDNTPPKENEMMNFAFLFLERNEENLNKILSQSWIGTNKSLIKEIFWKTTPLDGVNSYTDFIKFIQRKI